jgi:hypothetical protein
MRTHPLATNVCSQLPLPGHAPACASQQPASSGDGSHRTLHGKGAATCKTTGSCTPAGLQLVLRSTAWYFNPYDQVQPSSISLPWTPEIPITPTFGQVAKNLNKETQHCASVDRQFPVLLRDTVPAVSGYSDGTSRTFRSQSTQILQAIVVAPGRSIILSIILLHIVLPGRQRNRSERF